MLHHKLINPKNIAVIGASNNVQTPGGRVLKNLIDHNFKGELFAVNPKETEVQGVKCFQNIKNIPSVDVAIIAIAAKFTLETIKILVKEKNTKGFIIFSAGFSEKDAEGAILEKQITELISNSGGSLLGPNNIGLIKPVRAFINDGVYRASVVASTPTKYVPRLFGNISELFKTKKENSRLG